MTPSPSTEDSAYIRVVKIKGANGEERTLQFPAKLDLERPKRPRTTFTDQQLAELERAFTSNGYLTGSARKQLAARLGLSDTQVKVWFQNRRTKCRKLPKAKSVTPSKDNSPASSTDVPQMVPTMYMLPQTVSTFFPSLPTFYPYHLCS